MFKKQGDVPRQLGWSAADHWGLAPWMASHGGSGTHIGFPKSLRLHTWKVGQDELAKFMGDTSWQRTVALQCLHENRKWDLCIDEGSSYEITCIPAFFQQKEAAAPKISFKRPLWFNSPSWDFWLWWWLANWAWTWPGLPSTIQTLGWDSGRLRAAPSVMVYIYIHICTLKNILTCRHYGHQISLGHIIYNIYISHIL